MHSIPLIAPQPPLAEQQQLAAQWFEQLQNEICAAFELEEQQAGSAAQFTSRHWKRPDGGGGHSRLLCNGYLFEKVGVNFSIVHGKFDEKFINEIPGARESQGSFWASGISLVAHMASPLLPSMHMNTRMLITDRAWFGGCADITPTFPDPAETSLFHAHMETACRSYSTECYAKFKQHCAEYFYLPHRREERGVGGIFYDNLNSGSWERDFSFTQEVGNQFLAAALAIIRRHAYDHQWNDTQKHAQELKRGRYVEFNLLYDRGTRFGLMTGGDIEAVLMSMPPLAKW